MTPVLLFIRTNIPRTAFLTLVCIAITIGLIGLTWELSKLSAARRDKPFSFYGEQFSGLADVLKGETYVGYYTDKDIQQPVYGAQFEQAQLSLAPLVLDLNQTNHRFIIFDCNDEKECWRKIAEVRARPLKRSNTGIILAVTVP